MTNQKSQIKNGGYRLVIDAPEPGVITLTLSDAAGAIVTAERVLYQGSVDNILLTAVDNLLKTNTLERSALTRVAAGRGIDKNSSLYRMVTSFASAVHACLTGRQACPPVGRTTSATSRNGR